MKEESWMPKNREFDYKHFIKDGYFTLRLEEEVISNPNLKPFSLDRNCDFIEYSLCYYSFNTHGSFFFGEI